MATANSIITIDIQTAPALVFEGTLGKTALITLTVPAGESSPATGYKKYEYTSNLAFSTAFTSSTELKQIGDDFFNNNFEGLASAVPDKIYVYLMPASPVATDLQETADAIASDGNITYVGFSSDVSVADSVSIGDRILTTNQAQKIVGFSSSTLTIADSATLPVAYSTLESNQQSFGALSSGVGLLWRNFGRYQMFNLENSSFYPRDLTYSEPTLSTGVVLDDISDTQVSNISGFGFYSYTTYSGIPFVTPVHSFGGYTIYKTITEFYIRNGLQASTMNTIKINGGALDYTQDDFNLLEGSYQGYMESMFNAKMIAQGVYTEGTTTISLPHGYNIVFPAPTDITETDKQNHIINGIIIYVNFSGTVEKFEIVAKLQ